MPYLGAELLPLAVEGLTSLYGHASLLYNEAGRLIFQAGMYLFNEGKIVSGIVGAMISNSTIPDQLGYRTSCNYDGGFILGALQTVIGENRFIYLSSLSALPFAGAEMHSYTPSTNWAGKWDNFNNNFFIQGSGPGALSKMAYGIANSIWTVGSQYRNKSTISLVGDDVTNMRGQRLVSLLA